MNRRSLVLNFLGMVATGISCVAALAQCSSDKSAETCTIGSEGCVCTKGGACDPGLTCLSNRCVNELSSTTEGGSTSTSATTTGTDHGGNAGVTNTVANSGGQSSASGGATNSTSQSGGTSGATIAATTPAGAGGATSTTTTFGGTGGAMSSAAGGSTSATGGASGAGSNSGGASGAGTGSLSCVGTTCVYPGELNGICSQGTCGLCSTPDQCMAAYGEDSTCSANGSCSVSATLRHCSMTALGGAATATRKADYSSGVAPASLFVAIGSASLAGKVAVGGVLCSVTQEPVVTTADCYGVYRCESCKVLITGTNTWVLTAYQTKTGVCAKYNALYWLTSNGSSGGVSEACSSCYDACAEFGGCNCCTVCGGCLAGP
jgi:hypothetical protein